MIPMDHKGYPSKLSAQSCRLALVILIRRTTHGSSAGLLLLAVPSYTIGASLWENSPLQRGLLCNVC